MTFKEVITSRTMWGAVAAVIGKLASPEVLAIMPEKPAALLQAAGILLGVFGFRAAISKATP